MKTNRLILLMTSLLLTTFIIGCGENPVADKPTNSIKGLVGSSSYIIHPSTTHQDITAISSVVMSAGATQTVSAFASEKNGSRALTTTAGTAVTTSELRAIIDLISNAGYLSNLSTINEQVFSKYSEYTVGDYSFTTSSAQTTVALTNQILNTLVGANTAVLPSAVGGAVTATSFRMFVTVTAFNSHYYYSVAISPDTNFNSNFALMTALASGSNYTGLNERLVSNTQDFVGRANSNQADFLFVIDDSGSMADQQAAISAAANDFGAAIALANLNFNIAIITTSEGADGSPCTGSCYDRVVKDVGIIDNDINLFKTKVIVDTNGSGTETGIYNSEQALKRVANGDSFDGLLNTSPLSFPRANTQLSTVILSDEVSQYSSRAGTSFNPANNLFIRDNILVNAIVDIGLCGAGSFAAPGEDPNGQYDDLAIATGGLVGNICREVNGVPNFSAIMQNIVFQAAGAYRLNQSLIKPNSVVITVNGVDIPSSIINGYMYLESTHSIAFFGTSIPAVGDTIHVYYEYPKEIDLFRNN